MFDYIIIHTTPFVKRFLLFLFIISSLQGTAQKSDSLWANWKSSSLPDTVRFASMKELILDYYLDQNSDSTIILAQMLYDVATQKGNKKFKAYALLTQGKAYYSKGENLKAIDIETRSLIISQGINDKKAMGNTLCNLGNVFLEMGNYSDAIVPMVFSNQYIPQM